MNLKDTYNKIANDWVKNTTSTWWHESTDRLISFLKPGRPDELA